MNTLTPEKAILKFLMLPFMLIAISLGAVSSTNAQSKSKSAYVFAPEADSANIDQCANGGVGDPAIPCAGAAWQNGALNGSQAHYNEGDSVPYRVKFDGLTVGNDYTFIIEFDSTVNAGIHAIDYLTSFDRTETLAMGNNPCSGVGCSLGTFTTFPIPLDTNVRNGTDTIPFTGDDIVQIPGVFTMFGATLTGSSSAPVVSGPFSGGATTTQYTVTFTALTVNPVLAFGGHISTRLDWGLLNSAVSISGSPFHVRRGGGVGTGQQDKALSSDAVIFPATITVKKNVPFSNQQVVTDVYPFTSTLTPASFDLDVNSFTPLITDSQLFSPLSNFGSSVTITETDAVSLRLISVACVNTRSGLPVTHPATVTIFPVLGGQTGEDGGKVVLSYAEGDIITCTFTNNVLLAADATLSGRVLSSDGAGISNARIVLTDLATGQIVVTSTGTFGYYHFGGLSVGAIYTATVSHRRYTFLNNTATFSLSGDLSDANFVAAPQE